MWTVQIDPWVAAGVLLATAMTDAVYVAFTTAVVARRRVPAAHLEQYLVPALVLRRDQLHQQLALRAVRGGWFVDWRLPIDDVPASGADQSAAAP